MWRWTKKRLRIYVTNFGRDCGWYVELEGRRLAMLTDPVWQVNMQFWHIYKVTPLTDDPAERAALATPEFWHGSNLQKFMYENREIGTRVNMTLPSPPIVDEDGSIRISMRSLFVDISPGLLPWEHLLLFLRRCWFGRDSHRTK